VPEHTIINGEPGERWTNNTGKVQYQFHAALINTCGVCLQYHNAIGSWWPIPIHHGCRCHQTLIKPAAEAPHPFVDYRELLDAMPKAEQAAAIEASNYKLFKAGVVKWEDIVTRSRVRNLREVVAKKKLTVDDMKRAGVGRVQVQRAYTAVRAPEHELVAQQRQEIMQRLVGAGLSQEAIVGELSKCLAARVMIAEGPMGPYTEGSAWGAHRLPGVGASDAAALGALLSAWRPTKTRAVMGLKPAPADVRIEREGDELTLTIDERTVTVRPGESVLGCSYSEWRRIAERRNP
jgi:hypothetical protein